MLPIPKTLLRQGVRDMLRISDARMSGTSYGACILHVAPEAQIGGPLAAVRTGDRISVDVPRRSIHVDLSDAEIAERIKAYKPLPQITRVAITGCLHSTPGRRTRVAFDFLEGAEGIPEPEIH